MLAATTLGVLGTLAASGFVVSRYAASAYVVVSPGASTNIQASEADVLATTYAGLLRNDTSILAYVSRKVDRPVADVHQSISVLVENTTAVLKLTYTADNSSEALIGSQAIALAITGTHPVSSAIPPNSVVLVSLPSTVSSAGSVGALDFAFGGIGGLVLGGVISLSWELLDPRVDSPEELAAVLERPVSDGSSTAGAPARALLERWSGGTWTLPVIALVAARDGDFAEAQRFRGLLLKEADTRSKRAPRSRSERKREGSLPTSAPSFDDRVVVYGVPGSDQVGENAALHAQTVVLVTTTGVRAADVRRSAQLLTEFGHAPDWGLLLPNLRPTPEDEPAESVGGQQTTSGEDQVPTAPLY